MNKRGGKEENIKNRANRAIALSQAPPL